MLDPSRYYASIQALRGIAAMAVVLAHSADVASRHGTARFLSADAGSVGGAGVDLFFVISGFIIGSVSGLFSQAPAAPRGFLERRIVRLVPLYWLYTTAVLALYVAAPGSFHSLSPDLLHVIASYLFIPWPRADGVLQPVLLVGWSLNMEMLFYAIVGAALAFPRRAGVPLVVCSLGLLALLAWDLWLEFLYGLLIAALAQRPLRVAPAAGWTLLVLGFALIGMLDNGLGIREPRALAFGVPAAMIVFAAVALDFRVPRTLRILGDASYSIYLSHLFTVNLVHRVLRGSGIDTDAAIVAAMALSAIAGVAAYWAIERPILEWARRPRGYRVRAGVNPAAASATAFSARARP